MKKIEFDLSEYKLISDETKKLINTCLDKETIDNHNHRMFVGFVTEPVMWAFCRQLGLKSGHIYYNGYFFNQEKQMILTFAEGDIYLKLFNEKSEYDTEMKEVIAFFIDN